MAVRRLCALFIRQREHRFRQPALEFGIVAELLEQLGIVLEDGSHHPHQSFVMFDTRILAMANALPATR